VQALPACGLILMLLCERSYDAVLMVDDFKKRLHVE
jgi:hypothetical protein